jgi:uncharacterized FAD-dependent dehydrogenase
MKPSYDVVVVGAGPAGIFTALELSKINQNLKILIVDKGRTIEKRTCPTRKTGICVGCTPCSITSGWSGAGAFSDGKLSKSPLVGGRITDYMSHEKAQELIDYADNIYLQFGARDVVYGLNTKKIDDITYEASKHSIQLIPCPVRHLGTEHAFKVLKEMYYYLINNTNTEFRELTTVTDILVENNQAIGVRLETRGKAPEIVPCRYVVAAPGRGGADWLAKECAKLGIKTENNEVDIGVRVEVPNSVIDHLTKDLYEAKLVYYSDTFDNFVIMWF